MANGQLVGNNSGSCGGTGCFDVGDAGGNRPKNALQADPTVTSDYGSYIAKKAYMGDLQGNYYRFDFNSSGSITKTVLKSTGQPIYASSALMWVGSAQQYIFFATGSDMLPSSPFSTFGIGTFSMYGLKDSGGTVADAFTKVDMSAVVNTTPESPVVTDVNNKAVGIPTGERPSTSPSVAGEIVFFTTTVEGGVPTVGTAPGIAAAEPTYRMYAVTYSGSNGYPPVGTSGSGGGGNGNGNGNKSGGGTAIAPVKTGTGRATAPFVVDQHLYFATSSGSGANVEAFGDPNDYNNGVGQVGVRILSWREIRR
jgi:Tfp pilus tip-associated adhesin PilY1